MTHRLQMTAAAWLIAMIFAYGFGAAETIADRSVAAGEHEHQITFNFQNQDIGVFIRFVSEITGRNFLVDPRVRGQVTVISSRRIPASEVYGVFLSVLDVHGFSLVEARPMAKIVPTPEAVTKNVAVPDVLPDEDRLVTQVITLFYAPAADLKTLLVPLVSRQGSLVSVSSANLLIVTDTASNIQRLMKIISAVDVEDKETRIDLVPLRYADSRAMAATLNSLFEARPQTGGAGQKPASTRFFAAERTNALLIRSPEAEFAPIATLIRELDEKEPLDKGRIRIHRLSFARAEEAVEILNTVVAELPGARDSVRILSDSATNSLIVDADPALQSSLTEVIRQLDAPRSMVYIEALVMEVSGDRELQLGIEWSAAAERSVSGRNAFVGGGFRDSPESSSLPALVEGNLTSGFNLGVFTEPVDIAGVTFNNLAAVLRAFRQDDDVVILSTPQILAIDNEEARINISRNIPFQTSTSTEENQTFNSFEYRDVGTVLKVTPHIGPREQVRIDIELEITAVQSTVDFRPTTRKRSLNSAVLLRSGDTMVIGGIVETSRSFDRRKVPLAGDLPAAGSLFRIDSDSERNTRFFVFLNPRIVRRPLQAAAPDPMPDPPSARRDGLSPQP